MSAQLAVGRLDELVERHATALQPDASCGDPPTPYPYASGQNRNGQPTFGELMASLQFLLAHTLLMRFRLRCYGALWLTHNDEFFIVQHYGQPVLNEQD
jgi:hypothetical protein